MAKTNQTTQKASATTETVAQDAPRGRGRPASENAGASALAGLQDALDRINAAIMDHPGVSIAARAAKCARYGVPQAKVSLALDTIQAALDDAREAAQEAYRAPQAKPTRERRVNLLD